MKAQSFIAATLSSKHVISGIHFGEEVEFSGGGGFIKGEREFGGMWSLNGYISNQKSGFTAYIICSKVQIKIIPVTIT